ncbi:TPA: negative regulator GrlR [Serratia marcescens]|uniref:GrlR family regulatory protein n=1 Tax=Serratia marcescens TaxID=615 RepID=UPI0011805F02|nr:GrlR family regulatory protein [Serratia marcescens]TSB28456.1 negative regulator GrlR [Serratia marcescens]TXE42212.1 negative regulator GrlR [Serratia marcescens]HCR2977940.1 negative regulator GrlR [Serratia marcescens]HEI9783369.1 negative regulator GrlR [Serratia marcescens]HEJ9066946.1 negative regulator GrlR [Serratia marcescens]
MKDGLYAVNFRSNLQDYGSGIVSVKDNAINGGDHGFYYQGKTVDNKIKLLVKHYNPRVQSVFGNINNFYLNLEVAEKGEGHYELSGSMEGQPQMILTVTAKLQAALVA